MRRLLYVALSLSACAGPGASSESRGAGLPVSRVILYQNGIGYFEREGKVDGDVLKLQVRPTQVNDLLKSLTVIDRAEGRAVSVSLPLEKQGADVLAELPKQVREAGGLLQVFSVFRGARVRIDGNEGSAEGRVLGVEALGSSDGQPSGWRVTLKTEDDVLRVYPLEAIEEVTLADRSLSIGLDKSLDVSLDDGSWKPITVSVQLAGPSSHDLMVSYIAEMPLWKPAYRLVADPKGGVLLQGWAVVDNVSGEDWKQARLSLVAGAPMSFIYNLHAPQFVSRVDLTPQLRRAAAAPIIERPGMGMAPEAPSAAQAPMAAPMPAPMAPQKKMARSRAANRYDEGAAPAEAEVEQDLALRLEQQAPAAAQSRAVGALSRYDIGDPVDVPDRSSTLVSLVNARVAGEQIVLFRPESDGGNAYAAVRFTNATPVALERGPVAIYADGTFLGEGYLERMEKGMTTFLSYALDGGVTFNQTNSNSEEGSRLLKIHAGMLVSEVISVSKTSYELASARGEPVTVYVKTSQRPGWTMRDRPKDTVETPQAVFVPMKLAAGAKGTLDVVWQKPLVRQLAIDSDLSTTVLKMYMGSGKVPKEVASALGKVLEHKARLGEITQESGRLNQQHQALSGDQQRVRDNINLLRKTAGNAELQRSLVTRLAALEEQLGELSAKMVRLSEEQAQKQQKMNELISGITLEVDSLPAN
jgi:hypothetical protein